MMKQRFADHTTMLKQRLYNGIRAILPPIGNKNMTKSFDANSDHGELLIDVRQRLVNVENKINDLLVRIPDASEYRGSPHQRYGHQTFSQHGEDLLFVALLERLGVGIPSYLDIGANHPLDCSNTALLYKRGARGVNIDASPDVIDLFNRLRPDDTNVNVGVAGHSGSMEFFRFEATSGLNTFSESAVDDLLALNPGMRVTDRIAVPVITLDQVIESHCGGKCPDLLSLDAEGLDFEILSAASFVSRPKILCVETMTVRGSNEAEMDALLTQRGFRKYAQMYANAIYIAQNTPI
jgi:FkbM family methyltransferase